MVVLIKRLGEPWAGTAQHLLDNLSAIALLAYGLMLGGHAPVIGVSPFPL